jgi:hypothetical protein
MLAACIVPLSSNFYEFLYYASVGLRTITPRPKAPATTPKPSSAS